jgi:hypothetical protein
MQNQTIRTKHIGYNVVAYGNEQRLTIMQGASADEGAAFPPQEIEIYNNSGGLGIQTLRDLCNEILGEKGAERERERRLLAALKLCVARLEEYPDAKNGTAIQIAKTELA